MSVLCEYATAAYFAYCRRIFRIFQSSEHVAYFSALNGIFDSNFNIICVSVTYFYLVANRMASSMCPDPCGTRWGSWFQAILYHVSAAYLMFMWSTYFFKCRIQLTCPTTDEPYTEIRSKAISIIMLTMNLNYSRTVVLQ